MRSREGFHWFRRWTPSERQRSVLDALVAGRTNADIAADLGISLDGAKWHVERLLTETGLEDRGQLAEWWRGERESVTARRPAGAFLGLFARLAVVTSVVAVAVWLLASDFRNGGHRDEKAQASVPATVAAPVTAAPAPTPSPTPQPPGAWIFDLRDKSVRTLQLANCCMQWLDDDHFIATVSTGRAVVDDHGQMLVRLGSALQIEAESDGRALMYDYGNGDVSEFDVESLQTSELFSLGLAPTGSRGEATRDVAISGQSGLIAVAEETDGGYRLDVMNADGSDRRTVRSEGGNAWANALTWSPDGRKLLVEVTTRNPPPGRADETPKEGLVLDTSGRVLLRRPISALDAVWLGSGHVVFGLSARYQPGGTAQAVDVPSGASVPFTATQGLFCLSPDGRYGVYGDANGRSVSQRVVDLASGDVLMEAQTRPEIGSCDWTADSTRVVLSLGGK